MVRADSESDGEGGCSGDPVSYCDRKGSYNHGKPIWIISRLQKFRERTCARSVRLWICPFCSARARWL
eukprot:4448671-Alexandrium_andersonii.AAC.1